MGGINLEKKSSFFIFLIIIAVLTLVVAALTAFIVLVMPNQKVAAEASAGGQAQVVVPSVMPPDERYISTMKLFSDRQFFNLKNDDPNKISVCIVDVSIKYHNKLDGIKDVQAKMDLNMDNLKEIVSTYFQNISLDQIKQIETKAKAKEELKAEINQFLISTVDKEKDRRKVTEVVYEVVFSGWNYQ